ncbi:MAG: hypothetical protein mread185_000474 [Mycoplasmataceae bacterium]|nr:MAG: hypothetical protein mread185_000474 [Mycoplasmataceae bacterium]
MYCSIPESQTLRTLIENCGADKNSLASELTRLKGIVKEIVSSLSLPENATKKQILEAIRKLSANKESSNNTGYEVIKAENDKLKAENTLLKSGDEKYKKIQELLSRIEILEQLGFKLTDDEKNQITQAHSIEQVEEIKGRIIKGNFNKLLNQNSNYFKITIILATLAICSMIVATWSLLRKNELSQIKPMKKVNSKKK